MGEAAHDPADARVEPGRVDASQGAQRAAAVRQVPAPPVQEPDAERSGHAHAAVGRGAAARERGSHDEGPASQGALHLETERPPLAVVLFGR